MSEKDDFQSTHEHGTLGMSLRESGKAGGVASGKQLAGNFSSLRSVCLSSIVDGMECFVPSLKKFLCE